MVETPRSGPRHRRGQPVPLLRLGLILLILGALGVGAYLAAAGSGFNYTYATARAENSIGGYAFSYPPSWELAREGSTSKVSAPDGSVVVSLGRGPVGTLTEASATLVEQIKEEYERVTVTGRQTQLIGGVVGLTVSGAGRNNAGVALRFVAVTIQGSAEITFAITAFTVADADPRKVVQPVSEIVDSFRIT